LETSNLKARADSLETIAAHTLLYSVPSIST